MKTAEAGRPLRTRADRAVADRLARSAAAVGAGAAMTTDAFPDWLAERGRAHRFRVDRIPFADLEDWSFAPDTGNLVHRSGRFFTVEGLHVTRGEGPFREWQQPIIKQPEVGILGILAKEFDGVLHFLMQAKMEPGNSNLLQLSPTVQATRSNYTKAHKGADVKYIDYFIRPSAGSRVLADSLQSEHGSWFFRKSNRNMIVETDEDIPHDQDFCWLTLGQIGELLRADNVVNMDARTVLACAPVRYEESGALWSDTQLLSWFTGERARHEVRVERIPLNDVADWKRDDTSVDHVGGSYFRVVAVSVSAGNREVTGWTQPLFEPRSLGVTAFVTRSFGGVRHLLAHARVEGGFLDTVEFGPTVQYTPDNYAHLTGTDRPPFLDLVLSADPSCISYQAVHSEEGGRFLNAESRYLFIDADESQAPTEPPPGYRWVTAGQLTSLTRHGHYVNVQARTLLALLNSGCVRL
ncbi:NDP-hexose 2,3-dehydratase family protein [Streptomyces sp. NBC_01549]|uniref:NDP-hexose 2,3-dehydratase family protein n=1 Tax=Streptomyces sp. NBC_01549 TaxID=2975874 RepID=UPI00225B17A9|nr:NDP-hexose 2,3-dehydratase family protein [Streptomyces sp. NBC_01549]MCX4591818.1 NDP-hexose 2,3-dehydratase family protein [Streptomyces sp. NBC_01549]